MAWWTWWKRCAPARLPWIAFIEMAVEEFGDQPIYLGIVHARDIASGKALMAEAKKRFNSKETILTDLSISLAANFGPGTVGLVLYPVE